MEMEFFATVKENFGDNGFLVGRADKLLVRTLTQATPAPAYIA